jgi:hypothetical protein
MMTFKAVGKPPMHYKLLIVQWILKLAKITHRYFTKERTLRTGSWPGAPTGALFLLFLLLALAVSACGRRPPDGSAAPPDAAAAIGTVVPAVVPMPVITPSGPPGSTARPRLQLTLRSTPPGAAVTIDGRLAGNTPSRWEMEDDARPHDFAFIMRGYAPWRLRFSPSRDGVVHATLEAIRGPDAGTP